MYLMFFFTDLFVCLSLLSKKILFDLSIKAISHRISLYTLLKRRQPSYQCSAYRTTKGLRVLHVQETDIEHSVYFPTEDVDQFLTYLIILEEYILRFTWLFLLLFY